MDVNTQTHTCKCYHTDALLRLSVFECIGLGLFVSYLGDLFFVFFSIFIIIDHIISLKQHSFSFACLLDHALSFLDVTVDEESELFSNI